VISGVTVLLKCLLEIVWKSPGNLFVSIYRHLPYTRVFSFDTFIYPGPVLANWAYYAVNSTKPYTTAACLLPTADAPPP